MAYRDFLMKYLILLLGIITLIFAIKTQQWTQIKSYLDHFLPYENGGLP